MKLSTSVIISFIIISSITFFAAYALGMIGNNNISEIYHGDYTAFTYTGSMSDGRFFGNGTMHFTNDDYYSGSFDGGRFDGIGTYVFADGAVYFGNFVDGLAEGEGTYTNKSGQIIYEGNFSGGQFSGQGHYYSPEGWSYEGGFKYSLFDGEGIITSGDDVISGVWEKGVQVKQDEN
jgi:hypothetical protein